MSISIVIVLSCVRNNDFINKYSENSDVIPLYEEQIFYDINKNIEIESLSKVQIVTPYKFSKKVIEDIVYSVKEKVIEEYVVESNKLCTKNDIKIEGINDKIESVNDEESKEVELIQSEEIKEVEPIIPDEDEVSLSIENPAIVVESGISKKMYDGVLANYMKAPLKLRELFESSGWKIIISNTSLKQRFGYEFSILALTLLQEKEIYIDNRENAKNSILHELGHFVDYSLGFVSSSDEFVSIYEEEVNNFVSFWKTHKNNTSTPIEYFAEAYQVLIVQPDRLIENCPKTVGFLRGVENEIFE